MQKPCKRSSRLSAVCSESKRFFAQSWRNRGCAGPAGFCGGSEPTSHQAKSRVVIVGGGFGGTTCAKYLRRLAPGLDITLIERSERYVSCPFSNAVIGGLSTLDMLIQGYDRLSDLHGIKVLHDQVTAIDPAAHSITSFKGVCAYPMTGWLRLLASILNGATPRAMMRLPANSCPMPGKRVLRQYCYAGRSRR